MIQESDLYSKLEHYRKLLKIRRRIKFYQLENISTPFITGLFNPAIYLPGKLLDKKFIKMSKADLGNIILHELAHYKRNDLWIVLFLNLILILHWFNPLIWYVYYEFLRDKELACDEYVLSKLQGNKTVYGKTLLKMAAMQLKNNKSISFAIPFIKDKQITRRIKMISQYTSKRKGFTSLFFLLFLFIISVCINADTKPIIEKFNIELTQDTNVSDLSVDIRSRTLELPLLWPVEGGKGKVTSKYGIRKSPITGKKQFHQGIDIGYTPKTPIIATGKGIVIETGFDDKRGNYIVIQHINQVTSTYTKLKNKLLVKTGDDVAAGQIIAYLGDTGIATGPHIHYEIREQGKTVNPAKYLFAFGKRLYK